MSNSITKALIRERLQYIYTQLLQGDFERNRIQSELHRLLEKSIELDLPLYQFEALKNLGVLHAILGELDQGLDYHLQAQTIAEKNDYISGIFNILNNLSNIYDRIGQPQKALQTIRQALEMAQTHPELKPHIILAGTNLGNLLCSQELYLEAETIFKYCMQVYHDLMINHRRDDIASRHLIAIYAGLAIIYTEQHSYRIAREYATLAESLLQNDTVFSRRLMAHLVKTRLAYYEPQSRTELQDQLSKVEQIIQQYAVLKGEIAHLLHREALYWRKRSKTELARHFAHQAKQIYETVNDQNNLMAIEALLEGLL